MYFSRKIEVKTKGDKIRNEEFGKQLQFLPAQTNLASRTIFVDLDTWKKLMKTHYSELGRSENETEEDRGSMEGKVKKVLRY